MIDTGDLVRIKHTRDQWLVCCVHDAVVYLNWPGNRTVRLDDIELVRSASTAERHLMLTALAQSSGAGHRPRCARERLGNAS